MQDYDVADLGLAAEGRERIDFADRTMPVLQAIRPAFRGGETARRCTGRRLPARHG